MKNQESQSLEPKKEKGVWLTAEQKKNNPGENGGFWHGFLKQSTNQLVEFLKNGGNIYEERETTKKIREEEKEDLNLKKSITDYIKKLLDGVPKGLKNFLSEEEMLLRALCRYKKEYGFADGSEMEIEYHKLWKAKMEKRTAEVLEKHKDEEYDFDNVSIVIEKETALLVDEEPYIEQAEVKAFRDKLWEVLPSA